MAISLTHFNKDLSKHPIKVIFLVKKVCGIYPTADYEINK